jgi:serine/threonine protein phosphatase PrpC
MEVIYYINKGKVRGNNEDGLLVDDILVVDDMDKPKKIEGSFKKAIVSDGMGGLDNGEVATKILLNNFKESNINSIEEIQETIQKSADNFLDNSGCATAGILFESGIVFNVGDCRVYRKMDMFLNRVTKDHSLAEQLIEIGELKEENILEFDKKNVLTSAVIKNKKIEIYTKKIKIKKNDIFLVCSDGLWGELSLDELEECFNSYDIEKIATNLIDLLNEKEQNDNISFIIVKV